MARPRRGFLLGIALATALGAVRPSVAAPQDAPGAPRPPPAPAGPPEPPRGAGARPAGPAADDPDPVAPRLEPAPGAGRGDGARRGPATPPDLGDGDPTAPAVPDPDRPLAGRTPFGPEERMHLETDAVVGRATVYDLEDGKTAVAVIAGNPHLWGVDYGVKARTLVVWFEKANPLELGAFLGGGALTGAPAPAAGAKAAGAKAAGAPAPAGAGRAAPAPGRREGVIPDSIVALYAEGAVELVAGMHTFRAAQLCFEPPTGRMLVVEARYDGALDVAQGDGVRIVPLLVRAERARGLADGFVAFDAGEVTTSRANDRLTLRVRTLTIEEYGEAVGAEPLFLGFGRPGTQRFEATDIQVRGERVPLVHVPHAAFGGDQGLTTLPLRVRRTTFGSRSSLGRYGFVGFGSPEGQPKPWWDWSVDVGAYTKRGPAVGTDLVWRRPQLRGAERPTLEGRWQTLTLYDTTGRDRNGYDAGRGVRGFSFLEQRFDPSPRWRADLEANLFSDRGIHRELEEADARDHKARDTYARGRFRDGGLAATATVGVHARPFATESFGQPEVALWSESVPLLPPSAPVGVDLSSEVRAGRWVRALDEDLADDGYEAWRLDVTERLHAPFDVGDVRVSPFVGARLTSYRERTDGGDDVDRGALEAGVTGNLALWRDFGVWGGPWRADGIRHVVDVDVGGYARFLDDTDPEDAPFFDRVDGEEDRTEVFLELRSRLETRRVTGRSAQARRRETVTLLDARLRTSWWPDGVGPWGRRGPGETEAWLTAELLPRTAWLEASALADHDGPALRRAALGLQWTPEPDVSVAFGVRHVRDALLGPWVDAYWRWSEKWAVRLSAVEDFERRGDGSLRITLLRFSPDHWIEGGPILRDHGRDVGFYFSVSPAIGGRPTSSPFQPREAFGLGSGLDGAVGGADPSGAGAR